MSRAGRTLAWKKMRRVQEFILPDLVDGRSPELMEAWVALLVEQGYVQRLSRHRGNTGHSLYSLIKDTGVLAPYWDRQLGFVDPNLPGHPSDPQQRIWESILILREFTPLEVARAGDVKVSSVQRYLKVLHHADYLLRYPRQGRTQQYTYRLVRNTGAIAPHIEWRGTLPCRLFDGNLEKFVWEEKQ